MPEHLQALSTRTQLIPNPLPFLFGEPLQPPTLGPVESRSRSHGSRFRSWHGGSRQDGLLTGHRRGRSWHQLKHWSRAGEGLRMSCNLLILRQARALHAHRRQAQKVPQVGIKSNAKKG